MFSDKYVCINGAKRSSSVADSPKLPRNQFRPDHTSTFSDRP